MPKVKKNRVRYPVGWELVETDGRRKEIFQELYEFCMDQGYADRNLIAKWKKPGYERLCCLRCIQPRDHNFRQLVFVECPNTSGRKVLVCALWLQGLCQWRLNTCTKSNIHQVLLILMLLLL